MRVRKVKDITLWSLASLTGVFTVASAYAGYVAPSMSAAGRLAPLLVMAFPGVLLLCIILTGLCALLRCRAWMATLGALIAAAPSVWAICPLNFSYSASADGARTFKVLSFNVKEIEDYGEPFLHDDGSRIFNYIIASGADIVCLQELDGIPRDGEKTGPATRSNEEQRDVLRRLYPYRTRWGCGALTTLSKYPMEKVNLGQERTLVCDFYGCSKVTVDSTEIYIVNCHLQPIGLHHADKEAYEKVTEGAGTRADYSELRHQTLSKLSLAFMERSRQCAEIAAIADSLPGAMIVCGDFNDVPLSHAVRTIERAGLRDVYAEAATGPAITYHANRFYFRIDQMLWRGPFKPYSFRVNHSDMSDHYAIEAEFEFDN